MVLEKALYFLLFSITSSKESSNIDAAFWESNLVNLKGHHLNVCVSFLPGVFEAVKRDSNGQPISFKGTVVDMIEWFAKDSDFTFDYVFDIVRNGSTPFSLIDRQHCDVYLRAALRLQGSDIYEYLHPYTITELWMLIPMPEAVPMNIDSVWKPFQPLVWVILLAIIPIAALSLAAVDYGENRGIGNFKALLKYYGILITKSLLSQSAFSTPSSKWKLRLAVGTWVLAVFVLVTAYSSVLISFILTPQFKPLIETAKLLAERTDLNPVMIKGNGAEVYVMSSPDPVLKQLTSKLKANSANNRVSNISTCFDRVKQGGNVCLDTLAQFIMESKKDYDRTGQCPLHIQHDNIGTWYFGWMVNKGSPLRETINRGILKMIDNGLVAKWYQLSSVGFRPPHCFEVADALLAGRVSDGPPRLSLGNLTGPFIILLVGYTLSLVIFILKL